MASTLRSNAIIPEVFTPYLSQATNLRSRLIQSGAMVTMPELNATEGGDFVNVPNWAADLSGEAESLTDTTSMTPSNISAERQIGVVVHRGKLWAARELAKLAAGDDPMVAIGSKMADWTSNQIEKEVFAGLDGFFGPLTSNSTGALRALTVDSQSGSPAPIGPRQVVRARALLGDMGSKLQFLCVHSAVFYDMVERKMIDYVTAGDSQYFTDTSGSTDAVGGTIKPIFERGVTQVPVFGDLTVIVSDNVPTSGGNYGAYFLAPGAIATGSQQGIQTETDRDIAALEDAMNVHWHAIYHPMGARFNTAVPSPTRAQFGTVANWTRAWATDTKNYGMVRATVISNFD
jgi:hypothetical protein